MEGEVRERGVSLESLTAPCSAPAWAHFTGPTPPDTISLSYSHGILQRVLDFSLSQEHIPTAHSPKHAFKGRDPLPVNHTSHEAVGKRVRLGTPGWET